MTTFSDRLRHFRYWLDDLDTSKRVKLGSGVGLVVILCGIVIYSLLTRQRPDKTAAEANARAAEAIAAETAKHPPPEPAPLPPSQGPGPGFKGAHR